jgi:molybdate/tungstate transport system substrate-binding protein
VLKIIYAGSLIVPFEEMGEEFEKLHPDVDVSLEGHGSIQVIRYVTELYHEADVLAVADYSLIPMMMYDTPIPGTNDSYANWNIKMARNSLGIAYTNQSKYADELTGSNWYEILSRPDVTVGIADARFDSCGYRTLMMCQLAEQYYGNMTIFDDILGNSFTKPITVSQNDSVYVISVPEILAPSSARIALRGNSVYLLYLLDSGDVDYAFEYESVAQQHGLNFLKLPDEINLGSAEHADLYSQVKVKLEFQRFASIEPEFRGEAIIYGITIPHNAPHTDLAVEFIKFVISEQGQEIFRKCDQEPVVPPVADNVDNLPYELKIIVEQANASGY